MISLQKIGGWAALFEAFAYIVGFATFFLILDASNYIGPVRQVEFLADHQSVLTSVSLLIYALFGIALILLSLALHERVKAAAPILAQVATIFGLIWAGFVIAGGMIFNIGIEQTISLYATNQEQAASLWQAIGVVHEGLGGGVELVGGLWVSLISLAALKDGSLPKLLNYLGMAVGVAGVATMIPALGALAELFGLGQIFWFSWLGIAMLRTAAIQ